MKRSVFALLATLVLVTPAHAIDQVKLVGGDILYVTIIDEGSIGEGGVGGLVVRHPVLGEITIPPERILEINRNVSPPGTDVVPEKKEVAAPTEGAAEEAAGPAEAMLDLDEATPEPLDPPKVWSWSADLSFVSVTGNTDETSLRFGADALRRVNDTRWNFNLTYYWKQTSGTTTDNKLSFLTRHDWLKSGKPLFWFVDFSYDYDQFESWTNRIAGHGGPAYHFIESEKVKLDGLAGIGFRKEFGSVNDDWLPEAQLGLDFAWEITERQRLIAYANYFPIMTDIDDFRTRSGVEWRYILEGKIPLTFSVGLRHEYQNIVDPNKDRNDLRIWVGLGVTY